MTLRLLGKDPSSDHGNSPTIWRDDDGSFVVQGWRLDAATMAEIGKVPDHETVVRIPARMLQFFPEVNGGGRLTK